MRRRRLFEPSSKVPIHVDEIEFFGTKTVEFRTYSGDQSKLKNDE